jgi:hypothetical protein
VKIFVLLALASLGACSWFGSRKPPVPDPTEIIVTGAPTGALLFMDGAQIGQAVLLNDHAQTLRVAPGAHTVEIHVRDRVVYREELDLHRSERRVVTVLSGAIS